MQLTLLKSKIHRATVTGASLDYEGSLTVSADIAQTVGLLTYEKILVGNLQNGERFETYVIYGAPGKGLIELNGATAHLGKIGHLLTIMSFRALDRRRNKETSATDCRARPAKQSHPLRTRRDAHQPKRMGNGSFAGEQSPIDASLPSAAILT
jgi:aspartate 1-decarboxylase